MHFFMNAPLGTSYPNASFADSVHLQGVERKPNLLGESVILVCAQNG
jgi:hypothetical protein